MSTTPKPSTSDAVLIAAIIVAGIVVLGAVGAGVALVLLSPPGTDLVKIIGAVGTALALLAAQVASYMKSRTIDTKVDYLANGGTDAKVRAGIADVVRPEFLRDEAGDQLAADRLHRANSPSASAGDPVQPDPPAQP